MGLSVMNIHGTIGEYQRNYLYKLFWEGPTNTTTTYTETVTTILAKITNHDQFESNIDIYNQKAVFPNRETNSKKIEWCGEFFEIPTTDASKRDAEFIFFGDEAMLVYRFFNALKNITGNETNQASVVGIAAKFNLGIAQVSVDKKTITLYRSLKGCRVYSVKMDDNDKGGSDISKVTVGIRWDGSELVDSFVGTSLDGDTTAAATAQ